MTVNYIVVGDHTNTNARAVIHTNNAGADGRLAYTTDPTWATGIQYVAIQVIDGNGYAKFQMTGLTANTQYYVRGEVSGAIDTTQTATFKTHAVAPGNAMSFRFAFTSCSGPVSFTTSPTNHLVWARIADDPSTVFFHLGDLHYQNINTNDQDAFRSAYQGILNQSNAKLALQAKPWIYIYDDHDFGPNDSDRTTASKPAVSRTYRQCFPHPDLALPNPDNGAYFTYTMGRIRFIVTDERYYRDPYNQSEAVNKRTVLGAVQKQWFKDQIVAAANDSSIRYTFWMSSQVPFKDGAATSTWGSYPDEVTELWDHFKTSGIIGKFAILCGDIHASVVFGGYDGSTVADGTAGIDLLTASPIEQYSLNTAVGQIPLDRAVVAQGQYSVVDVVDTTAEFSLKVTAYSTDGSTGIRYDSYYWTLTSQILAVPTGEYGGKTYENQYGGRWVRRPIRPRVGGTWANVRKVKKQ